MPYSLRVNAGNAGASQLGTITNALTWEARLMGEYELRVKTEANSLQLLRLLGELYAGKRDFEPQKQNEE